MHVKSVPPKASLLGTLICEGHVITHQYHTGGPLPRVLKNHPWGWSGPWLANMNFSILTYLYSELKKTMKLVLSSITSLPAVTSAGCLQSGSQKGRTWFAVSSRPAPRPVLSSAGEVLARVRVFLGSWAEPHFASHGRVVSSGPAAIIRPHAEKSVGEERRASQAAREGCPESACGDCTALVLSAGPQFPPTRQISAASSRKSKYRREELGQRTTFCLRPHLFPWRLVVESPSLTDGRVRGSVSRMLLLTNKTPVSSAQSSWEGSSSARCGRDVVSAGTRAARRMGQRLRVSSWPSEGQGYKLLQHLLVPDDTRKETSQKS